MLLTWKISFLSSSGEMHRVIKIADVAQKAIAEIRRDYPGAIIVGHTLYYNVDE